MATKHEGLLEAGQWEKISQQDGYEASFSERATTGLLNLVTPSFMTRAGRCNTQLRRTAYLDGLRGFAALMVYCLHHQLWAHEAIKADYIFENGFGYNGNKYFACLPGIRTFFSGGHYAVTVFFVISGYVLSAKPLSLIHAGEHVKLGDNLASALFRRWLRLFIPIIGTTFLWFSSWHLFGFQSPSPHPQSTYFAEVWNWYAEFKNFSFVFKTEGELWLSYNFHAWSIPLEFRGSIVIYTALMAFSRCTRNARLWCEVALIYYFLYIVDGWFCAEFVAGMLLCDLDLLAMEGNLPSWLNSFTPYKTGFYYSLLVISVFLGGVPSHSLDLMELRKNPGWYYLSFLKPQAVFNPKWFYLFFASTFLVACSGRISWLRAFFETRINQYLGHVSYAFYLVHGPILWTLGDRLYAAAGMIRESHGLSLPGWVNLFPIPTAGPLGMELAFLLPHLIILPLTLWISEIVTKLFDEPAVKFAAALYKRTLEPSPKI